MVPLCWIRAPVEAACVGGGPEPSSGGEEGIFVRLLSSDLDTAWQTVEMLEVRPSMITPLASTPHLINV